MKHRYVPKNFSRETLLIIGKANEILEEYAEQGFTLTLRQIYYQYVARRWLQNKQTEYKRLGSIVGDGRLAGLIDWAHMEDRTRNLALLQHFTGPQDALDKLQRWYHVDMWERQQWRPVVFIEKDALVGVIQSVCQENDVPYFSCRGYTSLSEIYEASVRFREYLEAGQRPYVIHFGDHDPSGIDMSRDILERLRNTFMADCEFKRVALNMDQVQQYNPPPNPAKQSDSRYEAYVRDYGDESWELDALNPPVFRALIEKEIDSIRDQKVWDEDAAGKAAVKVKLTEIAKDWESIDANKREVERLSTLESERLREIGDLKNQITKLKSAKSKRKPKK